MSQYLYNNHLDIFQRMNFDSPSTPRLPNIIVPEAVDDDIHKDKTFFLESEHDTTLDDADLIDAICSSDDLTRVQWFAQPREVQIARQVGWVSPMPMF